MKRAKSNKAKPNRKAKLSPKDRKSLKAMSGKGRAFKELKAGSLDFAGRAQKPTFDGKGPDAKLLKPTETITGIVMKERAKSAEKKSKELSVAEDAKHLQQFLKEWPEKLNTFERIDGHVIPLQQKESYMSKKQAKQNPTKAHKSNGSAVKVKRGGGEADTRKITVVAKDNPRREGTSGFKNFKLYKTGMTVAEFVKKGGLLDKMATDAKRGHIRVS